MTREGTTQLEVLVALAVLGVTAGLVGLAARAVGPAPDPEGPAAKLLAVRREALITGQPTTVTTILDGRVRAATAWPDGSVRADSGLAVDPLSGKYRAMP